MTVVDLEALAAAYAAEMAELDAALATLQQRRDAVERRHAALQLLSDDIACRPAPPQLLAHFKWGKGEKTWRARAALSHDWRTPAQITDAVVAELRVVASTPERRTLARELGKALHGVRGDAGIDHRLVGGESQYRLIRSEADEPGGEVGPRPPDAAADR